MPVSGSRKLPHRAVNKLSRGNAAQMRWLHFFCANGGSLIHYSLYAMLTRLSDFPFPMKIRTAQWVLSICGVNFNVVVRGLFHVNCYATEKKLQTETSSHFKTFVCLGISSRNIISRFCVCARLVFSLNSQFWLRICIFLPILWNRFNETERVHRRLERIDCHLNVWQYYLQKKVEWIGAQSKNGGQPTTVTLNRWCLQEEKFREAEKNNNK